MLLTITTRAPATDLGYLLHKHPDRVQAFATAAGTAHVFYPEAPPRRCTAALLLEVDPVALVRGPAGKNTPNTDGALAQYVNDRPYAARRELVTLAREHDVLPAAIVLDLPEKLCAERNAGRPGRDFGAHVIRRQRGELRRNLKSLPREGFRTVHVLRTPDEVAAATITRTKLFNDLRHETGPFDVVGDARITPRPRLR